LFSLNFSQGTASHKLATQFFGLTAMLAEPVASVNPMAKDHFFRRWGF